MSESHTKRTVPPVRITEVVFWVLLALATVSMVTTIQLIFLRAPLEAQMGIVQKIFYFHVPSAFAMYFGAFACFLGSAAYLFGATDRRDALARAGAEVAVVFGVIVLTTGPLWAAKAWGHYWTWEPRLTTSLLSVLIYISYLVLRSFGGGGEAERRFAAALGFLGAVNLPIIHFSVQKWSGQHPQVLGAKGGGLQHIDMKIAFGAAVVTFLMFATCLLWVRYRVWVAEARLRQLERDALELGVEEAG